MSVNAAFLRKCADMGMSIEQAVELAETLEAGFVLPVPDYDSAAAKKKARDAARMRAKREAEARNDDVADDVAATSPDKEAVSLSPTPPNPSQEITTPFTPLKGGVSPSRPKAKAGEPAGFAGFWNAYPEKVGRLKAVESYRQAVARIDGPDPPAELLAAVERAKLSRQWLQGYIPNPSTWLNQGRWMDQPSPPVPLDRSHERPDHHSAKLAQKLDNLASSQRGFALNATRRAV